jgi:predicted RNA-binding Zn ribbon-like protein
MPAPYTLVGGFEVPVTVSGHPGLELCNTFAGWNGPPEHDYLLGYGHLAAWAATAGVLRDADARALTARAAAHPAAADAVVADAREIRARLYEVLVGRASGDDFDLIAHEVQRAAAHMRLVRDGDTIRREVAADAGLAAPVFAALWQAGELLVSPAFSRVRACPGSGCGWLFLDRTGRRRWCTMGTCGNRAKARRFAARRRPTR